MYKHTAAPFRELRQTSPPLHITPARLMLQRKPQFGLCLCPTCEALHSNVILVRPTDRWTFHNEELCR